MTFLHKFTLFFGKKPKNQSHFPINNHSEDNVNLTKRHSVGTCLWHVSLQTAMYQRIGNMPKACPYVMMHPPIVTDINHRICQAKGIGVSFYLRFRII